MAGSGNKEAGTACKMARFCAIGKPVRSSAWRAMACRERVPLSTSSQSGWLNSSSARASAPSGPRTERTMPTGSQLTTTRPRSKIIAILSSPLSLTRKTGPVWHSFGHGSRPPTLPRSTPPGKFYLHRRAKSLNGYDVTFRTTSCTHHSSLLSRLSGPHKGRPCRRINRKQRRIEPPPAEAFFCSNHHRRFG